MGAALELGCSGLHKRVERCGYTLFWASSQISIIESLFFFEAFVALFCSSIEFVCYVYGTSENWSS